MADEDTGVTPDADDDSPSVTQADVDRLKTTIKKERKTARDALKALKAFDGIDPDEVRGLLKAAEKAEHDKAAKEGDFDKQREILEARHDKALGTERDKNTKLENALRKTVINDALNTAIADAGVVDQYRNAARLELLQKGPRMVEDDGNYTAAFTDDLGDSIPLAEYVTAWTATDPASAYMPTAGTSGSGTEPGTKGVHKGAVKTVSSDDLIGMGRHAAEIADGSVVVVDN